MTSSWRCLRRARIAGQTSARKNTSMGTLPATAAWIAWNRERPTPGLVRSNEGWSKNFSNRRAMGPMGEFVRPITWAATSTE